MTVAAASGRYLFFLAGFLTAAFFFDAGNVFTRLTFLTFVAFLTFLAFVTFIPGTGLAAGLTSFAGAFGRAFAAAFGAAGFFGDGGASLLRYTLVNRIWSPTGW